MPADYPSWNDSTPHTDAAAQIKRVRSVTNVSVIEVTAATYRGCAPVAGCFELVNPGSGPKMNRGVMRVEVYCAWHGVKPRTRFPQIDIGQSYTIRDGYSGEVIDNLA